MALLAHRLRFHYLRVQTKNRRISLWYEKQLLILISKVLLRSRELVTSELIISCLELNQKSKRNWRTSNSQGVDRLILDVRSCVEEDQDPAVKVADLFMPQTTIVQISGRDGVIQKISGDSKVAYKGQLLVLTDFTTAGGAEIVAGAIQDAGTGKVFGVRTYGRGGIQKLLPAGNNYIVLTTQKYVTPKGKVILNNGIDPAIPFKDDLKSADIKADEDRMLNKAIDYFRHPAA